MLFSKIVNAVIWLAIFYSPCAYIFSSVDSEDNVFSLAFFNYLRDILELMNKIPIFEGENKNYVNA